ncbi:MAG TPA: DMT family transporter [Gammaproteobacteria bacterium]|nr:DMT family transporter [Gammaproteobacteria bacterium]
MDGGSAANAGSNLRPSPIAGSAFGALAALIWAGFPAITKMSMASSALDAWDVTALRFGVAGLLLLPLFARRRLGELHPLAALFLACGAGAPYVLLTAGGLEFAPGGHMGVMTPSCMLLCSTLGSRLVLKEALTGGRIAGAFAIAAGLVTLGWDGLSNHGELTWLGDAMFVLGGLFWASYTIGLRVWRVDALHATAVVGVLSMALYLPGYAWLAGADLAAAPWREIVIQAVFQGVLSAVVALLLYTRAVTILGAARGAVFAALVPAFSLLLAIPLLHETPTALQLVGVMFVTAGMVFALGLHDPAKWRSLPMRAAQR